ncbi:MAG: NADPH-dependent FMN reductase [Pseudomonadota bacterium]
MSVVLIAGSPSTHSRSSALLEAVGAGLQRQAGARRVPVDRVHIRDLSPQALVLADASHGSIARAIAQVAAAKAVVVATPVYQAAYSGVLKTFLDLLPQSALRGKAVLPLATGGSPHHMLALDYALRPVLQSLGARHILPGVYACDAQVQREDSGAYRIDADVRARLDDGVNALLQEGLRRDPLATFEPVSFSDVRYSH